MGEATCSLLDTQQGASGGVEEDGDALLLGEEVRREGLGGTELCQGERCFGEGLGIGVYLDMCLTGEVIDESVLLGVAFLFLEELGRGGLGCSVDGLDGYGLPGVYVDVDGRAGKVVAVEQAEFA